MEQIESRDEMQKYCLIQPEKVAAELGVSTRTLTRYVDDGHLPVVIFGRKTYRYDPQDLVSYADYLCRRFGLMRSKVNELNHEIGKYMVRVTPLMTIADAAEFMSISKFKLVQLIRSNRIPVEIDFYRPVISLTILDAFISRCKTTQRRTIL